jgi:AAA15 family ATPase/GTPase
LILEFKNLGAIKNTELDLRPLTVIIGPNNSNKTYVAYSVYGIYRNLIDFEPYINRMHVRYAAKNRVEVKIDKNFISLLLEAFILKVVTFKDDLTSFFQDSSRQLFKNTHFNARISPGEVTDALHKVINEGEVFFSGSDESILVSFKEQNLIIAIPKMDKDWTPRDINRAALLSVLWAIEEAFFSLGTHLLPAERNAFILTYKLLGNRRYKLLKETQRGLFSRDVGERQVELLREQGDIRYAQPIEDFLDLLADIELNGVRIIAKYKDDFQKLADKIEKSIQGNNKIKLRATRLGGREILVGVRKGLDIDLYNASSSIKQLTPLLLYLRYRAVSGDLLIIDEPEMNLHPESQAKLLEALAVLVKLGVKVLLTTHSPYFMAHLNNLIIGNTNNGRARKSQASRLYLKDGRAFLPKGMVGAYEMKGHELRPLHDEDYGIRWDTLSDVSSDLQQKFFQIYDKGQPSSRAKKR